VHSDKSDYIWRAAAVALDEAVFAVGEYVSFRYSPAGFLFLAKPF